MAEAEPRLLRVLHLEDDELDHALAMAQLRRAGVRVEAVRVDTEAEFLRALERRWDVVVSDYNLPGFSGLVALDLLKASGCDAPFVLVSGEIGEDTAVEAMRNGASDYLLKDKLARLGPAVLRAVEAAESRRERARAGAELDASKQRLHELAQYLQTSVESERVAIAREIHDDVGGSLTALKFELAWMSRHCRDDALQPRLAAALETVTTAIESTQRIMHNLRPAILEQGLVAALQWMAARFERRTGVTCLLKTPPGPLSLPPGVPLVAYRAAQEALTNITKHAQATHVDIDLALAGGVLSLEIADNGRGFPAEALGKAGSFGIRGLHERAGTVGGWVDVSSGPGGTTLILSVPLDAAAGAEAGRDAEAAEADPTAWGGLE